MPVCMRTYVCVHAYAILTLGTSNPSRNCWIYRFWRLVTDSGVLQSTAVCCTVLKYVAPVTIPKLVHVQILARTGPNSVLWVWLFAIFRIAYSQNYIYGYIHIYIHNFVVWVSIFCCFQNYTYAPVYMHV